MLKRFLFLFGLVGVAIAGKSQFNDSTPYYISVNANGFINNTNEQKAYVLTNRLGVSMEKSRYAVNVNTSWVYGEQNGSKVNNDLSSTVDANFLRGKRGWYYWALTSYEKSLSLRTHNRFQCGGGPGYVISDSELFKLIVSDGLLYERSELYDMAGYHTVRNSFRIKFRLSVKDRITLEGTDFIQHSLSDANDYILLSHTSLSVKLSKWLSLTSSLTYNRMNINNRENLQFNYGLVFERYF